MSLTYREIEIITRELKRQLIPGRLINLFQYEKKKFIFSFIVDDYSQNLLISLQHPFLRLHLTRFKIKDKKRRYPFGEFLKKKLEGATVKNIVQLNDDRIIELKLSKNETIYYVVLELFSKKSELYLLDSQRITLANLSHTSLNQPYTPKAKTDFQSPDAKVEYPDSELFNYYIDEKYRKLEEETSFQKNKELLLSQFRKEKNKTTKLIANLQDDYKNCLDWEKFQRYGELLKANFPDIKRHQTSIRLFNYYENSEIEIPLNPLLSPQQNMEKYFKKSKKLKSGLKHNEVNIRRAKNRLDKIEEHLANSLKGIYPI